MTRPLALFLFGFAVMVGGPYLFSYIGHLGGGWAIAPSCLGALATFCSGFAVIDNACSKKWSRA